MEADHLLSRQGWMFNRPAVEIDQQDSFRLQIQIGAQNQWFGVERVKEDVKRNVEALMPGGGFVFNTVHNIQGEVPPENIVAMWDALAEYGKY